MISILEEIRKQPLWAREVMFGLSVITTLSLTGMAWFSSFQHNIYALNNPGKNLEDTPAYVQNVGPQSAPMALISKGFSSLKASVYDVLNIHTEDTVDARVQAVYPLPIAPDRTDTKVK